MATYSDFSTDVIAEAPGAPSPLVTRILRRTVRDFCKRTWCSQADLSDLSVISGTQSYTLSDPSNNEIIGLVKVQRAISGDSRTWKTQYNDYTFDPPTFTLDDSPTESYSLEMRAALRPDNTTTTVDDLLYDNYYEGIVAGALYRLFRMRTMPWSDDRKAALYYKEYSDHVRKAITDLNKQFTNRTLTVQMRTWV